MEHKLPRVLPILPVTDLRNQAKQVIRQAQDQPVVITQNGRPSAVLLNYESYNRLITKLEFLGRMEEEEREFWHFASEESLKRVWDNDADAVYDDWEKLYGKKH